MSDKQEMIKKMVEMQKKFTEYEQQNGVAPKDYWKAPEGHLLHGYRDEFNKLANQLIDMAHSEKGSHR